MIRRWPSLASISKRHRPITAFGTFQGIALSLKGDTEGALTSFDKALHLSATYEPALKGEVEILFRSGDKRAVPLLERILKSEF